MRIRVRVSNYRQFGRLADRFRAAADGGLRTDLASGVQGTARPVVAKVQARVQQARFPAAVPSVNRRPRSTGLRDRLAAATSTVALLVPPGVRFTVDGSVVNPDDPRGGHALARYTDTTLAPRWRHQTFGREDPDDWFIQLGDRWFFVEIDANEPRFVRAVEVAMDKTARRIER